MEKPNYSLEAFIKKNGLLKELTSRISLSSWLYLPTKTTQYHILVSFPAREKPRGSQPNSFEVILLNCGSTEQV